MVFGNKNDFAYVKQDKTRFILAYDYEDVDESHARWREVIFYKKKEHPTIPKVKEAIKADIDKQTENEILTGFIWNNINIWLSKDNQRDFSEAQHLTMLSEGRNLPLTLKIGETSEGNPVYHTFEAIGDLDSFYTSMISYIQKCLTKGWKRKDAINWEVYDILNAQPKVFVED